MIHVSGGSRISRRGGVDLIGGAVDPRGSYVLKILHVKMKESGPMGGACAGRAPLDPPMHVVYLVTANWLIVTASML